LEKDTPILKRFYFVKYRYDGVSLEESAQRIGVTWNEGYIWQRRWNEEGYEGQIPLFAGSRPMKLSPDEFDKLKDLLNQKTTWTTEEVQTIIYLEFGVKYTLKQIRIILKKSNIAYGKLFTHDYLKLNDAESLLKTPS
jgi:putative transposase